MQIINGKELAEKIETEIKNKIKEKKLKITLAVLIIEGNKASDIYVRNKEKACARVGINSKIIRLPNDISQENLEKEIIKLSNDNLIDGILLQLPLPKHLNEKKASMKIPYEKNVDGFDTLSMGRILKNEEDIIPCTPKAVIRLLEYIKCDISSKNVVIVGRSNIVGRPLALMMTNRDATVTLCHRKTKDLSKITKKADILISATGDPNSINNMMIKKGSVLIDVGISKVNNKITGDFDFYSVYKKASYITPVPGGVGPMTISMLLENTLILKERAINNEV